MNSTARKLTWGQVILLVATALPMVAVAVAGGIGTFTNLSGKYGSGTAIGALAAGEGATAVAALALLVTTLLNQTSSPVARAALWLLPAAAAAMGVTAASTTGQAIIFGLTPMGMTAGAEGLAFLARRVVVHRTGVDLEVQRRNAQTVQRLAYHRSRAVNHPLGWVRKSSELTSWRLAKKVGVGDTELGVRLVQVQRDRLAEGADAALLNMFHIDTPQPPTETVVERVEVTTNTPEEVTAPPAPELEPAPAAPEVKPLVICGGHRVWDLEAPGVEEDDEVPADSDERLPAGVAANVIRAGFVLGTSVAETARQATRSTSYVKKVFARLEEEARTAEETEPPVRLLRPAVSE
ncbi:conjugal transfer protein [Streptomyces sp. SID8374]|uniref:conjugal transfer protein n=1 Tax=Streptomyces sp. SID8374 TaxID=2690354 RepID=UPI001370F7BC|nr:conjugal transfer protein [Streptomyces sp. SID8374]MYX15455.1 conjugal transfer protein [Streptomyces sp. SID8374]